MPLDEIVSRCRRFIETNFLYMHPGVQLKDDDLFFEMGVVDSTGAMELVAFVEESFDVAVDDMEITVDNFGSLSRLGAYVREKLAAA